MRLPPDPGEYLLQRGRQLRRAAGWFAACLLGGAELFVLLCLVSLAGTGRGLPLCGPALCSGLGWAALVLAGIRLAGCPLCYFWGLHYIGLGQLIRAAGRKNEERTGQPPSV